MENNDDCSFDQQQQLEEAISAGVPLLDVLALMKKEKFQPTMPVAITERLFQVSGCVPSDPKVTKLVSAAAQTFIAVVAKDALHHYKMRGAPQSNRIKGKDGKDEIHNTLMMEDLMSAVEGHGIHARKPTYFV